MYGDQPLLVTKFGLISLSRNQRNVGVILKVNFRVEDGTPSPLGAILDMD